MSKKFDFCYCWILECLITFIFSNGLSFFSINPQSLNCQLKGNSKLVSGNTKSFSNIQNQSQRV